MQRYDITAVGESLIDFVTLPGSDPQKLSIEGNPGGAPANVLAAGAKLGLRTAFIGKLGQDAFGRFLAGVMRDAGVDTRGVVFSAEAPTTLAFVSLDEKGDRSFSFYRQNTADVRLEPKELDRELIASSRILHFGSVSLTDSPAREATLAAARYAREQGVAVSYDPNLRPLLWKDLNEAKVMIAQGLDLADYAKVSEEELEFLAGEADVEDGMARLMEGRRLRLLVTTMGPRGCACRTAEGLCVYAPAYDVKSVDTTGAGDTFWGAALHCILTEGRDVEDWSMGRLSAMLRFANAAGSLSTTRRGAIPAMPGREEIEACVKSTPPLSLR